jgi:hypothetical protein
LGKLAASAKKKREELGQPLTGPRSTADLVDSAKWGLGNLAQFAETTKALEAEFVGVKEQQGALWRSIRRLENDMLKGMLWYTSLVAEY